MKAFRMLIFAALSCCLLITSSCSRGPDAEQSSELHIVATTYPLYVLACAVTAGTDQITVGRLSTGQVSCLHDYTLTVSDMRQLETADLLLLNGAGLEDFMTQILEQLPAPQIDCSENINLLESDGHTHHEHSDHQEQEHDHDHEHDPHYWMDPRNLSLAASTISSALAAVDPEHESLYLQNAEAISEQLDAAYSKWQKALNAISCSYLITFHDGFHYFAEAFGLELLFSMEEEDGATASAKDILTASTYVKEYSIPAIFTEVNGSGAAARAVSGETGVNVGTLSMLMDGADIRSGSSVEAALSALLQPMSQNIATLSEVLK